MKILKPNLIRSLFALSVITLSGCSYMLKPPVKTQPARLGIKTKSETRLQKMPNPKEKIVAAVYNFRDKTGQYKMTETGGSWSSVVTQGSTSILLKALEESGWFIPIEREGLGNLLNERKIIRSSRAFYKDKNESESALPPLLFAGIMLEGGIISYDYNTQTGGIGVRYFGAGASGQYRKDRVTVYLRAVSTKNGKILKTVYSSKTVLSQKMDAGIFRYVKFKRLLEAETGFTYNEPTELAVREAIEKAVESLIIEGVFENLWELEDPEKINSKVIQDYIEEKQFTENEDALDMKTISRPKKFGISMSSGFTKYSGDYKNGRNETTMEIELEYNFKRNFDAYFSFGNEILATHDYFRKGVSHYNLGIKYRLTPEYPFSLFFATGIGVITPKSEELYEFGAPFINKSYMYNSSKVGVEYLIGKSKRFGLKAAYNFNYIFSDEFDGVSQGKFKDFYSRTNFGLTYFF